MNISIFNSIKFKNISLLLIIAAAILSGCSNDSKSVESSDYKTSNKPLLRAEEAFKYEIEDTGSSIKINWSIEDGYYLLSQKNQFCVEHTGYSISQSKIA